MTGRTASPGLFGFLPRLTPFDLFIALCAFAVLIMHDSVRPLWAKWMLFDQSLAHGLPLFLIICGWLVSCRARFNGTAHTASWLPLPVILGVSLGWYFAALGDIEIIEQLALIAMFGALAWLTGGHRGLWVVAAPLAMLLFCIPILDEFNSLLVRVAAWVMGAVLGLTPITFYLSGNAIVMPEGTIVIADGCSGLRYLAIGLAIVNLAGSLDRWTLPRLLVANAVTVLTMLAVNWVRIGVLTVWAYFTSVDHEFVRGHETFGWIVFVCGLLPLLIVLHRQRATSVTTA